MTVMERNLAKKNLQLQKELKDAKAGVKELEQAVEAVIISTALAYGAKLPDGGMVLTMARPAVALNSKYIVRSEFDNRDLMMRVEVWEKNV